MLALRCGAVSRVTVDALLWLLVNLQFCSQLRGQYTKEVYLSQKTEGVASVRSACQQTSRALYAIGRPHAVLASEHVCFT